MPLYPRNLHTQELVQSEDLSSEAAGYIKAAVALVVVWSIIVAVVVLFMYKERIEEYTIDFKERFQQGLRDFGIRREVGLTGTNTWAPSRTLGSMRVENNLSQTTIITLPPPTYTRPPSYASATSLIPHRASFLLVDNAGDLIEQAPMTTSFTVDDPPLPPPDIPPPRPLRIPPAAHTRSPTPPRISTSSLHALVP